MKVKDLLPMSIDVDCYDDVCESLAICFCGPMELTEEGEKEFAEVLEYPIELYSNGGCYSCTVLIDDESDQVWKSRLKKAKRFFEAAAGYCADESFSLWFVED